MPTHHSLTAGAPWVELASTPEDYKKVDPAILALMLGSGHLIRAFEESLLVLAAEGLVHGPVHSSIGQEGGAVGSAATLRASDAVNGSHRGHHQFLAKAINYVCGNKLELGQLVSPEMQAMLTKTMSEILGLAPGFSHGRGGSMHLQWLPAGALGTNAIVGGGAPLAAGHAYAQSKSGTSDISVTYFGDGAINIGSVLESFNLAAAWKLPICFFVENNRYAVSTLVNDVTAETRLSARALGFGIPSWKVDGMDPLAVHLAMQEAEAIMRAGGGPTLIEADVYRYFHQSGPFPGSAFGYRTKEEEAQWKARDPLDRLAQEMIALGQIDEAAVANVRAQAQAAVATSVEALIEKNPADQGKRRVKPELWPSVDYVDVDIRGDASELAGSDLTAPASGATKTMKFSDVIAGTLERRMDTDPRIVVLGEDIHRLNGGTNGATKGLWAKYPERTHGTPISENAFFGLAGGMAMDGRFRPVVEFMYSDFMWVAADQVFNQIGKARHMFGGNNTVPLVLRTKVAMGSGYGSQHTCDPAGIFATQPGWRIVAPANAADYIGLMNAALKLDDPVLVLEHIDLYPQQQEVSEENWDYVLEPGKARVVRTGDELTVISYLSMVGKSENVLAAEGINADLIDLRWLDRASLDWDAIERSVKKTNNVVIVEQGARGASYGTWLAEEITRKYFDYLDQPVFRIHGKEASPSISKILERAAFAGEEEIAVGLKQALANKGAK